MSRVGPAIRSVTVIIANSELVHEGNAPPLTTGPGTGLVGQADPGVYLPPTMP